MNDSLNTFDWNHMRAFLATAEGGSLSAAARALGQTQPTLGRQVAALEAQLGIMLFERVGRSLALTQSGRDLLEHVRSMGEAANRISLAASGQSQSIEGRVRITASDIMSAYVLPPVLRHLRQLAPLLDIDIVAANDIRDLMRREADIAI
ncbi:MAG: LysR family transcriptional regulator, partial [Paracoccaceae bacterium]|nr:LysR family transcriptional regulator [Paracoccaceae bacterium]